MGCLASKPETPVAEAPPAQPPGGSGGGQGVADTKDVMLGMASDRGSMSAGNSEEVGFVAWSEMENAEEQDYLVEEEQDAQLDQLLEKQYSDRHRKQERSYNDPAFWLSIMNSIEPETGPEVFQQLTAPFTLKKAHQLYRYLRSGKARTLPKKSVYEVLIAACKQLEAQSKEHGALQRVPAPTDKSERLYVCGDTHGQLQARVGQGRPAGRRPPPPPRPPSVPSTQRHQTPLDLRVTTSRVSCLRPPPLAAGRAVDLRASQRARAGQRIPLQRRHGGPGRQRRRDLHAAARVQAGVPRDHLHEPRQPRAEGPQRAAVRQRRRLRVGVPPPAQNEKGGSLGGSSSPDPRPAAAPQLRMALCRGLVRWRRKLHRSLLFCRFPLSGAARSTRTTRT